MLKTKTKRIFASALAATVVIGCFTVAAFAQNGPTGLIGVQYCSQVQDQGWQPLVLDGKTSGTTGHSLRMEALKVNLTNAPEGTGIKYSVYVQDKGWMPAVSDGDLAGTVGQSKRIEAIKLNLTGLAGYTVEYRVHIQNIGWMDWQRDGAVAGTIDKSLRLEAIEIRILLPPTADYSYESIEPTQSYYLPD